MGRLVTIRSSRYGLDIELDPEADFDVLLRTLSDKFKASARFFKDARMALSFSGRTLTRTEEDAVLEIINDNTQIDILCVVEQNDKNEPMYRSIVEHALTDMDKKEGQFYRGTLGKREILESDSSVVILGDVEPGARVVARGSVVIVGALYGSVRAGAAGDKTEMLLSLLFPCSRSSSVSGISRPGASSSIRRA